MAPTDLHLRPAERADCDVIATIHLHSRREAAMPAGIHTEDEVRDWLGQRLGQDRIWIAEAGETAVAYARFTDTWLDDLYVLPGQAHRGYGSALLDVVKGELQDGFCLWVFEQNEPARAFYARRGLIELERTDGAGNEERQPDIRMAWPGRDPLGFFRGLIDETDRELGEVLNRRSALTRAVQPHKPTRGRDAAREQAIAASMAVLAPTLGPARLSRIIDTVITESLDAVD